VLLRGAQTPARPVLTLDDAARRATARFRTRRPSGTCATSSSVAILRLTITLARDITTGDPASWQPRGSRFSSRSHAGSGRSLRAHRRARPPRTAARPTADAAARGGRVPSLAQTGAFVVARELAAVEGTAGSEPRSGSWLRSLGVCCRNTIGRTSQQKEAPHACSGRDKHGS
jgi:hypothetical protein